MLSGTEVLPHLRLSASYFQFIDLATGIPRHAGFKTLLYLEVNLSAIVLLKALFTFLGKFRASFHELVAVLLPRGQTLVSVRFFSIWVPGAAVVPTVFQTPEADAEIGHSTACLPFFYTNPQPA